MVVWEVTGGGGRGDESESGSYLLQRRWKGKLHLGSVEGLAWQEAVGGGSIATVGADCIVNLFKLVI